jgi:hypothetical protein
MANHKGHPMKGLSIILLFSASAAMAQVEQGAITGAVTDQSNAVVPNAQITVTNMRTGVKGVTQTAAGGYYSLPYLSPGRYEVTVEQPGFKKARVTDIDITIGLTATINVKLEVGETRSEIQVAASAVQLEQQKSTLGIVVESAQMVELPLNGRDLMGLVALAPGVLPNSNVPSIWGSEAIINGGRANTSEVMLDGAESRNTTTYDPQYTAPLESVQEIEVITNNFSSEYGRSGGGVLTAASRGGTNDLHGSFYEFLQNAKLNANGWTNNSFSVPRTPYQNNQYGFSIGGPVYVPKVYNGRNRTFFFVNFEEVSQRSPNNFVGTVPTILQRQGDFSQTLRSNGQQIVINDPLTTRADPNNPGHYIRDAFPLNKIPKGRFDLISSNILGYYPTPTNGNQTQNEIATLPSPLDFSKLFLRLDQAIGTKHRLFFTLGRQNGTSKQIGLNPFYPGAGVNSGNTLLTNNPRTYVLSDTVTIRPNLLAEFRGSVTRAVFRNSPYAEGFDFTQLGFPQSEKAWAKLLKFPRIDITDVNSLSGDRASFFNNVQWSAQAQGHLTWIHGAHTLKTGIDRLFAAFNVYRPEQPSGQYSFNRTFTQGPDPLSASSAAGYGVATFLLGAPTGGQFSLDPSLAASQTDYGVYLQDDWKALRNLTVNLGVRWEYGSPWTERFNQLAFFDPSYTDPVTGLKGLLRFTGRDGNPRSQSDPNKYNFGPRVGLAWQFAKNMVMRAGYGRSYFPSSGGIGGGVSDLGNGFLTQTSVYLGPPPAAPNTPPAGASLANAFVGGLLYPPTTLIGSSLSSVLRNWPTPLIQMWNFNIQRMLPWGVLVETAYVGSRGMRYWVNRQFDAVSTQYLSLGTGLTRQVANPFYGVITTGSLSAPTVAYSQLLRPFPQYTGVTQIRAAIGDSVYHGFTLHVKKKTSHGLTLQANYTISKEIDDAQERFAGRSNFIDPNNLKLSRAISEWDRPNYLVISYVYELPFGPGKQWLGKGALARIVASWQVSGVTSFGSGVPLVITAPCSTNLPGVNCTPLRLKDPVLPSGQGTISHYFDTTAFAVPPAFSLGSDSRTEPRLRAPGINNFDLGISRNQRFREQRINLQFRAELFSAFNHTQFDIPDSSVTSPTFGQIMSANGARTIQLALRLSY